MSTVAIDVGEFLYDLNISFTSIIDFGIPLQAILNGEASPHPAGTRFDIGFTGQLQGPRIKGNIKGVDYLELRADGRFEINIRAVITTQDQHTIAFEAKGLLQRQVGSPLVRLIEAATFKTASTSYAWINQVLGLGQGCVDPVKGEVIAKIYSA